MRLFVTVLFRFNAVSSFPLLTFSCGEGPEALTQTSAFSRPFPGNVRRISGVQSRSPSSFRAKLRRDRGEQTGGRGTSVSSAGRSWQWWSFADLTAGLTAHAEEVTEVRASLKDGPELGVKKSIQFHKKSKTCHLFHSVRALISRTCSPSGLFHLSPSCRASGPTHRTLRLCGGGGTLHRRWREVHNVKDNHFFWIWARSKGGGGEKTRLKRCFINRYQGFENFSAFDPQNNCTRDSGPQLSKTHNGNTTTTEVSNKSCWQNGLVKGAWRTH